MPTITVTKTCIACGKPASVEVDSERYNLWVEGRRMQAPSRTHSVQAIFPEMSPSDREILISGTHDECWQKMWGEDD